MGKIVDAFDDELTAPDVIKRVRGGYLALSKRSIAVRIGATGDSEEEARQEFADIMGVWLRARKAEKAQQDVE